MNNSSTSNSDLRLFVKQISLRLILLVVVLLLLFFLPVKRSYYNQLLAESDYSKISWNENKLNATNNMDNTVLFMGSSICLNGVNDSLMNQWDTTNTEFINMAVSHTCFALSEVILEDMLVNRKLRPKHVYLCFKGDAMASQIHNMYPLVASPLQIAESIRYGNFLYLPSMLKHISWNINTVSRFFKYSSADASKRFNSSYGYSPLKKRSLEYVEKNYSNNRIGSEANFNAIDRYNKNIAMPLKSKITVIKADVTENIYFQRKMFSQSAKLLDEYKIPYDIIIYPNMISARMGRPDIMENYVRKKFTDIDFNQHEIVTITDTAFANAAYFADINHLNTDGAELLSSILLQHYQHKNSNDIQ
jgi:hypothetical protein